MSQLYSRVFLQILDSSIAEDFTVRHVFEDFLKLADHRTGVVDMTRPALARRLNVPIATLNHAIGVLEGPDPHSRDKEAEGRRMERLDDHRDWGWRIINWEKYEVLKNRTDVALRVSKHRAGIPPESQKFTDFYQKYPKKVARQEALKAWNRIPEVDSLATTIMAGLERAIISQEWTKDDGKFIPHPTTWLNQRRWEDQYTPVQQQPPKNGQHSVFNLKTIMEAKQKRADALKHQHASEDPFGTLDWSNEKSKAEYYALRKEIKAVQSQIASMA